MAEQQIRRRLAAILAADVAGYSSMMEADEIGTIAAMRQVWSDAFNPAVCRAAWPNREENGDGALVEFCKCRRRGRMRGCHPARDAPRNSSERRPMEFRIGINLGDIVSEGDDILGEGVNVAARLEGAGRPWRHPRFGRCARPGRRESRRDVRRCRRDQASRTSAGRYVPGAGLAMKVQRTGGPLPVRPSASDQQAVHRRSALFSHGQRSRAGVLRRRACRGHPHDSFEAVRPVGHRPSIELRLQGSRSRCAARSPGSLAFATCSKAAFARVSTEYG